MRHIVPIVEGHGEEASIRPLLTRAAHEILGRPGLQVVRPIRRPRSTLLRPNELERAAELAVLKGVQVAGARERIGLLVLLDADEDCPAILAPELLQRLRMAQGDIASAVVLANVEFETWFAASAESLGAHLTMPIPDQHMVDPETARRGKGWIQAHFTQGRYSETVDQPRMTMAMDLAVCRHRSPSFDKLCRDLDALAGPGPA